MKGDMMDRIVIVDERYLRLPNGRLMPLIAGGRVEPPAPPAPPQPPAPPAPPAPPEVPEGFAPVIPPPAPAPRVPPPAPPAPAAPPAPPQEPVQLVNVRIGARDFALPAEAAEAYQNREREFSRGITMDRERQQRLEALETWRQQVVAGPGSQMQPQPPNAGQPPFSGQPPGQPPQLSPDFNVLWFQDPARAAQMVEARTAAKWRAEMAERDFWNDFYRQNDIYREDDFFVKTLATRHYNELIQLPSVQARIDKLGELTGNEILRLSRKAAPGNGAPQPPAPGAPAAPRSGERPSGERTPEPTPEEVEEAALPKTLGEAIKMRRRSRDRAGARGGGRG